MNQAFEELVPHSAPMSLLDEVIYNDDNELHAEVTIKVNSVFAEERGVPAWVGIEYMAQTVAAYAGAEARDLNKNIKIGFLVGSRKYTSNVSYFSPGSKLCVKVKQEIRGENSLSVFICSISGIDKATGKEIEAIANLNVFQPDDPEKFLAGDAPQ